MTPRDGGRPGPDLSGGLAGRLLAGRGADQAARPALECGSARWSFDEIRRLVLDAAGSLAALGLVRGDRVLMVLPNSPEYVVSFLGITALGAVAVPIDCNAGPERLAFVVEDTGPKLCLCSPGRELPAGLPVRSHAVHVAAGATTFGLAPAPPRIDGAALPLAPVSDDAAAVILYSAGSTGKPKGAVLRHDQLLAIARTLVGVIGMDRDHRDLIIAPMTHSGGWQRVTSTLLAGGTAVLPESGFSVPGLLEDVRGRGIRGFFAAPPVLRVLMRADEARLDEATAGLRSIESASAPLAAAELERLLRLMPRTNVFFQYGLTECSRALILDTRAHPDKLHTVGRPTPGVEVAIADEDGLHLEAGRQGEILLAAPQLIERYWNRPDLDAERFRGRWLRTGDIGSLDADGFLTLHGRADDMINCGGLSFFPAEVENDLGPIDGVSAYLIAGVPDPQGLLGHVPWAFVVPRDPATWKARALVDMARRRLPPHMVPRRVVTMPSMPATPSGKPSRRRVLELYGPRAGG